MDVKKQIEEHSSNYFFEELQLKIYGEVVEYMKTNKINRADVAKKLGVSKARMSQILSGECNFSIKKLIELGALIKKAPKIDFVRFEDYWKKPTIEAMAITTLQINIARESNCEASNRHTYQYPSNTYREVELN